MISKLMLSLFPTQGNVKLSEILLVACFATTGDKLTRLLQNSIAFHTTLNMTTQHYCKDFYMG